MSMKKSLKIIVLTAMAFGTAQAKELQVIGRASVPLGSAPPQEVRAIAQRKAKREATIAVIEKVLGPSASRDPRVAANIDQVVSQISDEQLVDTKTAAANGEYQIAVTLVVDDKEFRTLLSDLGIAVNTASTRGHAILAVMDEFLTTPRDLKAPLEELEIIRSEVGRSAHDRSKSASAKVASLATASASETQIDAKVSSNQKGTGSYEQALNVRGKQGAIVGHDRASTQGESSESGSLKAAGKHADARATYAAQSSRSANDTAAEQHDNQFYMKLVKYQPQNGIPEKTSQTYNALVGQLQDYDLRVLDNDLFKSKYFKDKPLTIQEMHDGADLARYVAFAKTDASADFFMVGTSVIVDAGKNQSTGDLECTAVATIKTYSTADGESIASETFSEASTGRNINDCAGNVAKKIASIGGPVIGARVQEYWKRRSTYGREYVLTLVGQSLPLMLKTTFSKAVKSVPGVDGDVQRNSSSTRLQLVVTYKGTDPLDQALAMGLAEHPAFATLDSRTDGNQIVLCLGPCAEVEKKVGAAQ